MVRCGAVRTVGVAIGLAALALTGCGGAVQTTGIGDVPAQSAVVLLTPDAVHGDEIDRLVITSVPGYCGKWRAYYAAWEVAHESMLERLDALPPPVAEAPDPRFCALYSDLVQAVSSEVAALYPAGSWHVEVKLSHGVESEVLGAMESMTGGGGGPPSWLSTVSEYDFYSGDAVDGNNIDPPDRYFVGSLTRYRRLGPDELRQGVDCGALPPLPELFVDEREFEGGLLRLQVDATGSLDVDLQEIDPAGEGGATVGAEGTLAVCEPDRAE